MRKAAGKSNNTVLKDIQDKLIVVFQKNPDKELTIEEIAKKLKLQESQMQLLQELCDRLENENRVECKIYLNKTIYAYHPLRF